MLNDKGLKHILRAAVLGVLRKKSLVAQMPPAAHHRQVHTITRIRIRHRDDVRIGVVARGFDRLLIHHV